MSKTSGDFFTVAVPTPFPSTTSPVTVNAVFYDPADVTPIRRYAAPTGTGDGTSWETASSLADAWEAVGDNPGGGEVWAKTGFYKIGTTYRLYPNVVLRGGFDGPTIISGDGGTPDYWCHLDAATGRVWDGTTFNSPFADGVDPAESERLWAKEKWCDFTDFKSTQRVADFILEKLG